MLKKIILVYIFSNLVLLRNAFAAESGGMPQLNPEFWISQIFWLVISFGALYLILSKFILPKISANLEMRKSEILENIETAEKQRLESEKKIKEYDKVILESKNKSKSYFNQAREKILKDISKKKEKLDLELNEEIKKAENEINQLRKEAPSKINKIAIETASEITQKLIGTDVNRSSISAIVNDLSLRDGGK